MIELAFALHLLKYERFVFTPFFLAVEHILNVFFFPPIPFFFKKARSFNKLAILMRMGTLTI